MGIMIVLTVTLFFFLPYYMRIFLLDNKKTRKHMICWITVVGFISMIEFIIYRQPELVSIIILVSILLYYFFTYVIYIRKIDENMSTETIHWIVNLKYFNRIFWGIIILIGIFAIVDILILLFYSKFPRLISCYLSILIIMGYVQTILYGKEYNKIGLRLEE